MKEDLLRINDFVFGARYLLDLIELAEWPADLSETGWRLTLDHYRALEEGVSALRGIYDNHAGLQDRFRETGRLSAELADKLGAIGLAGRASNVALDLRVDHPWSPYDRLKPKLVTQPAGDVAARVQVRFDEVSESVRLCRMLLHDLAHGPIQTDCPLAEPGLSNTLERSTNRT